MQSHIAQNISISHETSAEKNSLTNINIKTLCLFKTSKMEKRALEKFSRLLFFLFALFFCCFGFIRSRAYHNWPRVSKQFLFLLGCINAGEIIRYGRELRGSQAAEARSPLLELFFFSGRPTQIVSCDAFKERLRLPALPLSGSTTQFSSSA